jgi:ABC-type thiamin/hydroxymethylpyrimidine transport system permease subunit
MEPEVAEFLKRVSYSIGIAFVWLGITCIAGIKGDNAFVGDHISIGNILFYIWFIASLVGLFFIYKKLWRRPYNNLS